MNRELHAKINDITLGQEFKYNKEPKLIQIPGSWFPHASFTDALWIKFQSKQLTGMHTGGRGGTLQIGKKGSAFKFLAPETITETHNHEWQEYSSIQSKILSKIIAFSVAYEQGKDIYNNLRTAYNNRGLPGGQSMMKLLMKAGDTRVPKYKMDTPLAYSNSQRRQYQLTFILADPDPRNVVETVKLLEKYAAAESTSEIDIEFPYVFSVHSEPEGLLNIDYVAITSILPNWMHPYIGGLPMRCELTISFTDMSPLFRSTIETGGIIQVNKKARESEKEIEQKYGKDMWARRVH
jgi:hypothetical protein